MKSGRKQSENIEKACKWVLEQDVVLQGKQRQRGLHWTEPRNIEIMTDASIKFNLDYNLLWSILGSDYENRQKN